MNYCGPRGIAWMEFLGWDRTSRDAAILWAERRAQTCQACGTHPDDWDPARGGDDHAYKAEIRACRGCETQASAQTQVTEAHGKGAYVVLVPNRRSP